MAAEAFVPERMKINKKKYLGDQRLKVRTVKNK